MCEWKCVCMHGCVCVSVSGDGWRPQSGHLCKPSTFCSSHCHILSLPSPSPSLSLHLVPPSICLYIMVTSFTLFHSFTLLCLFLSPSCLIHLFLLSPLSHSSSLLLFLTASFVVLSPDNLPLTLCFVPLFSVYNECVCVCVFVSYDGGRGVTH